MRVQIAEPLVHYEPMRAEDLDAVMEIERRSFSAPWSPGLFLHELKIPFSQTILARVGGEHPGVAGYVCRWLVAGETHILNLAVSPDWRRRGIARELVERVIGEARQAGAVLVTLEVRRGNGAAMALYRSLGFAECGVRRNYYGRGEDALVMSRSLAAPAATSPAVPQASTRLS